MFFASLTLLAAACQHGGKTEASTQTAQASAYACPMECEGEKTYDKPGSCPVCKMDLEPVEGSAATGGAGTGQQYEMRLVVNPAQPEAGKPATLAFTPRMAGNTGVVPLDEVHTKKMHVVVVSRDLGWYEHIHPEYQADGSYTIEQTFPGGGEYVVFADYKPTGGSTQVQRSTVNVGGQPKKAETFTKQKLTYMADGYTVILKPVGGTFVTNNMNHLGVDILRNGKPVTDLEEVMGAKGHLVIISGDSQKYLHVHPEETNGVLDLHTKFDQPGIYRAFFQFQTEGKLRTSYFTLNVEEGKPGEAGDHGHDHGDGHDHGHDHGPGGHSH